MAPVIMGRLMPCRREGLVLTHLGPPAEWPLPVLELTVAIAEELTYRDGRWWFDCRCCGGPAEWPLEPEDFDPEGTALVCGGSPRCCP